MSLAATLRARSSELWSLC